MKIVDSFLFSEPYEKELLLLKFILEDSGVDEWIIIENTYSFQGDYKGLHARNIVELDTRFKQYEHKIKFIEADVKTPVLDKNELNDANAHKVEFWQRDLAYEYFILNYSNEDWIMITDVDESIDFTSAARAGELRDRMNSDKQGILHVSTKRYWFDFDNEYAILYGIPMCTKNYLTVNSFKLHDVRVLYHSNLKMKWKQIIAFEYTSCFDLNSIARKQNTNSHTTIQKDDITQALRCNHRPLSKFYKDSLKNTERFFFKTIELNEFNSPKYVRDNLENLKIHNVDVNYKENRRKDYPELFTLSYYTKQVYNNISKSLNKKLRFTARKLKLEKLLYGSSAH